MRICVRKVQLEHIVQIIEGWTGILFAVPLFSGQVLQIIVTAHKVREQFDFHKKMFLEGFLFRERVFDPIFDFKSLIFLECSS